uniref:AlNc14C252G9668 protein n=1 Tax=Albugo laibachii Nc14 TaxID=890382 RepID=F0WTI9_9STRA|nr:AlNc14C252G9668 [Albugo laibachii Nc14]|eukprot:CCA24680.1 AlNc14C252G9668 [Albugo laibachii Nc14]
MLRTLQAPNHTAPVSSINIVLIVCAILFLLLIPATLFICFRKRKQKHSEDLKSMEIQTPSEKTQTTVSPKTCFTDEQSALSPTQSTQMALHQQHSGLNTTAEIASAGAGILLCDLRASAFRRQPELRTFTSTSSCSSIALASEGSIIRPSQVATAAEISAGLRLALDEYSEEEESILELHDKRYFGSMSCASDTMTSIECISIVSSVPEDCDIYDGQTPSSASFSSGILQQADLRVSTEF